MKQSPARTEGWSRLFNFLRRNRETGEAEKSTPHRHPVTTRKNHPAKHSHGSKKSGKKHGGGCCH